MTRQPALGAEPMDCGQEFLQSGIGFGSLQPRQLGRPLLARIMPAARDD